MTATADPDAEQAYSRIMNIVTVSFPGGVVVDATYNGHTVRTDQPVQSGGSGSAMSPFDLVWFLPPAEDDVEERVAGA